MTDLALRPLVSEKATNLIEERVYTFIVPKAVGKIAIAQNVAKRFGVKVTSVNTVRAKGKAVQAVVKRGQRRIPGQRSTYKKAYVTLAPGQSIKLFEKPKTTTKKTKPKTTKAQAKVTAPAERKS